MFTEHFEKSAGIIKSIGKGVASVVKKPAAVANTAKKEGETLNYKDIIAAYKKKNPNTKLSKSTLVVKPPPPMGEVSKDPSPFGMEHVPKRPQGRFAV